MATIIRPDGSTEEIELAAPNEQLRQLQGIVDGFIQVLSIGDRAMIINEEGSLLNLPSNAAATRIAAEWVMMMPTNGGPGSIAGTAVYLTHEETRRMQE